MTLCWQKSRMAFVRLSVTAFPTFAVTLMLRTVLLRQIIWVIDAKLGHHLLLFRWAWFSGGKRVFKNRRRPRSYWRPLMELLSKEICLVGQQDFGPFNFAKIKALCSYFFWRGHNRIDVRTHEVSKSLSGVDNFLERVLLFWLKRQIDYIILPVLQIF